MFRTRLLRRAELAAGDLRPDPLLRRLDLTDPGSERLRRVRKTLAGRTVVTLLSGCRSAAMAVPEAERAARRPATSVTTNPRLTIIRLPSYNFGGIPRLGLWNGRVSDLRAACKAFAGGC